MVAKLSGHFSVGDGGPIGSETKNKYKKNKYK
jgi:hypothetical protein